MVIDQKSAHAPSQEAMRGYLVFSLNGMRLALDASWLLIAPLSLWAVATIYVPIMGSFLRGIDLWLTALLGVILCGLSLLFHAFAHRAVARAVDNKQPAAIPLFPLGDAAQVWPLASGAAGEAWSALAGPLASGLLAVLVYGLWNAQLDPHLNVALPLVVFYNGALAILNLIPAFPLDGGRLLRAIQWGLLQRPAAVVTRWPWRLGVVFVALLTLWAIVLYLQPVYGSGQTAGITLLFAALPALPLWRARPKPEAAGPSAGTSSPSLGRAIAGWLLIALLLLAALGLVPTIGGLEIPGVAPSVAPMVEMPAQFRHDFEGKFILTTVLLQTPITVGEWAFAHLSPLVQLAPPEQIVPPDTTAQEQAQRQYAMLEESEATAAAVGLKLAGYQATIKGKGVEVVSVLTESPSHALLQAGDVITGINSTPIGTAAELGNFLAQQKAGTTIQLHITRDGEPLDVSVALMPPAQTDGPPRIGIGIQSAGFEVELPFAVRIVPQKIVGGPSAGLIFTLTIYNLATAGDLTGGHIIAGTGTIDADGVVGPIGGVKQKVAGAEFAGAEYFLSPPENYDDALAAARTIQVVKVATAEEAIHFLQSLPPVNGE